MNNYVNPAYVQKASGILSQYAPLKQYSNTLGGVGNAAGLIGGIQQGGISGDTSAAINAARLASRTGVLGQYTKAANSGLGSAANALGIYQGIKQGGVGGYGGAAVNAAQLGSKLGAFGNLSGAIGSAAGYAAIPLSIYNFGKNWQSGNTGSNALNGAATGAAIGSVVPGIGTAIGALIGGAGGALSSVFGPGRKDPETNNWDQYLDLYTNKATNPQLKQTLASSNVNPYLTLAGVMDEHHSTLPMYQQYGRMGEQKFTNDMVSHINDAIKSGQIGANDDASAIYNKVVDPWISQMGGGKGWSNTGKEYTDATKSLLTQMVSQYMGGQAANNWRAIGGDQAFANIGRPPAFAPQPGSPAPAPTPGNTPWTGAPTTQPTAQPQVGIGRIGNIAMGRKKGGAIARCFDDGGEVDTGGGNDYEWTGFNPGNTIDFNSVYNGGTGNDVTDWNNNLSDIQSSLDQNKAFGDSVNEYLDSLGSSGSTPSAWDKFKGNATGAGGLSGLLKAYAPLLPLVQGAISQHNTKAPSLPGGMTNSSIGAMPVGHFARTQNMQPTNTGQPMSQQDWYTYGSRPEASFYSNNQVPLNQTVTGQKKGGKTPKHSESPGAIGQATGVPEFNSAAQSYVGDEGPGDGQEDQVPAQLSSGEYVFDAHTVSMLGNGSNKAGAQRLDELRANLRKHAAQSNSKGKQFMNAKSPEQYMGKGKPAKKAAGEN